MCCRRCRLARPRTAKARKANASSGTKEPNNNDCRGQLQQRAGGEIERGKSQECMCCCRWRHRGYQRTLGPIYHRTQEANNKCSGLLQQRSGGQPKHSTSQECVCFRFWGYQGWQRPRRPMFHLTREQQKVSFTMQMRQL